MSTPQQRVGLVLQVLPPRLPITSNLSWWLDAAQINGVSGGAVPQWLDMSGKGNNVANATGSQQPIYQAGIVNGLPVVRFDGTKSLTGNDSNMPTGDISIFAVARTDASFSSGQYGCIAAYGTTTPSYYQFVGLMYGTDGGVGNNTISMTPWGDGIGIQNSTGAYYIFSFVRSSTSYTLLRNGGSTATKTMTASTVLYGANGLTVGIWTPSNSSYAKLNGDIAEVVVFGSALSTADRQTMERYLSNKWGIAI